MAGALAEVERAMHAEVAAVVAEREAGRELFPIVRFEDVATNRVPEDTAAAIRRRGCAVVKGTFPRARAEAWDASLAAYLETNRFMDSYRGPADDVFGGLVSSKPQIYGVYWSRPQIEARQDANMVAVRTFLNSFWRCRSEGRVWFDPGRDTAYPDRIRRREPGSPSLGLSPHTDNGSIERWLLPAYQQVFRHVFAGRWREYDPWDAAYRTDVHEFPSTVMCSVFRTFQGWTALSDMRPTDGVLHVVPIPSAMAYVLLRALQDDVADDDLCGAANGQALPGQRAVALRAAARAEPDPGGRARRHGLVALRTSSTASPTTARGSAGATSCTSRARPGARRTPPTARRAGRRS